VSESVSPVPSLERLRHRASLLLLVVAALASFCAAGLHHFAQDPDHVDRFVPLLLGLGFALLAAMLWLRPHWNERLLHLTLTLATLGLALPSGWHVWRAWQPGASPLVESLPPLAPTLIPLVLGMTVFLRPQVALRMALLAWVLIAIPILLHLFAHPQELVSPRGQELAIVLGPVTLLVLAFIPLHRGLERRSAALQAERERMQALAERDALTGLYNRRAAEAHLGTLQRDATRTELILFDVDHFKAINDRHGHGIGDAVLCEIATRCAEALGGDGVLARWGGEEFLVLAPISDGASIAERLRATIAARDFTPVGRVTASFGTTRLRHDDSSAAALLRADEALYAAKAAGRNRVATRDPE
jgi:diguanylate cyclase (GGDEF)-like protein